MAWGSGITGRCVSYGMLRCPIPDARVALGDGCGLAYHTQPHMCLLHKGLGFRFC
jgi:hypothetical protein